MKRVIAILAILSLVLSGCGLQRIKEQKARFTEVNNQLVGKTYDDLIKEKGVPTGEAKLSNGGRVVEYFNSSTETSGGGSYSTPTTTYVPNPNGGAGAWVQGQQQQHIPVRSTNMVCKLNFVISPQNIIESWKAVGNKCY
ncbi:MAG: hypothetical protein IPM27_06785 [Nitrosomonadales bacterium]|nr:hypothetical protein [Nitrosomonadales bacterium]